MLPKGPCLQKDNVLGSSKPFYPTFDTFFGYTVVFIRLYFPYGDVFFYVLELFILSYQVPHPIPLLQSDSAALNSKRKWLLNNFIASQNGYLLSNCIPSISQNHLTSLLTHHKRWYNREGPGRSWKHTRIHNPQATHPPNPKF